MQSIRKERASYLRIGESEEPKDPTSKVSDSREIKLYILSVNHKVVELNDDNFDAEVLPPFMFLMKSHVHIRDDCRLFCREILFLCNSSHPGVATVNA